MTNLFSLRSARLANQPISLWLILILLFLILVAFESFALYTTFTSKYHYGLWRPIDAIRRADEDGNADTAADSAWDSLFPSPPYPTYAGNAAGHGLWQ